MRFAMPLACELGELSVAGRTAMQRFDAPGEVVIVFTSLFLASEAPDLAFRQSGCLVLSATALPSAEQAPTSSSEATVPQAPRSRLQSYYRIHAEQTSDGEPTSARTAYIRDFVLRAQSAAMRSYQLSAMLQHLGTATFDADALPLSASEVACQG